MLVVYYEYGRDVRVSLILIKVGASWSAGYKNEKLSNKLYNLLREQNRENKVYFVFLLVTLCPTLGLTKPQTNLIIQYNFVQIVNFAWNH